MALREIADAHLKSLAKVYPQDVWRMSSIGKPCLRQLIYDRTDWDTPGGIRADSHCHPRQEPAAQPRSDRAFLRPVT